MRVEPLLARRHREAAAEAAAPVQRRGVAVVCAVPARVLHHGEGYPAEHRVLGVRSSHGLVLETKKTIYYKKIYSLTYVRVRDIKVSRGGDS